MYSDEQKRIAIELYLKYGMIAATVIRKLGYPNSMTLRQWFYDYRDKGEVSSLMSGNQEAAPILTNRYIQQCTSLSSTEKTWCIPVKLWVIRIAQIP